MKTVYNLAERFSVSSHIRLQKAKEDVNVIRINIIPNKKYEQNLEYIGEEMHKAHTFIQTKDLTIC